MKKINYLISFLYLINFSVFLTSIAIKNNFWSEMNFLISFLILFLIFIFINFNSFIKQFINFQKLDVIWLVLFIVILFIISIFNKDNYLGIITAISGVLCVVMVAKGNIWNYFWGVISVSLYSIIAYKFNYGANFLLNLFFYLPIQFIGFYSWKNNYNNKKNIVKLNKLDYKDYIINTILIIIFTISLIWLIPFFNKFFNILENKSILFDSFVTIISIFAQILMIKRYKEQWFLWIIVNFLSIILWIINNNWIMILMWSAYLLNSIIGYINWIKFEKNKDL